MNKLIFLLVIFLIYEVEAQTDWVLIDNTSLYDGTGNSTISGTISEGYVFKTISGQYYVANPLTFQLVFTFLPKAKIYQKGSYFMLIIEDFEDPVFCREPESVIQSRISGDFNGWEGDTIFKLSNGQVWQQSSYSYWYAYLYSPEVLIYKLNGRWILKVESLDQTIAVHRIR